MIDFSLLLVDEYSQDPLSILLLLNFREEGTFQLCLNARIVFRGGVFVWGRFG